ncbi:MAG: hypothetical protein ACKVIY_14795 [Acidimicrobiales bacterium]
MSQAVNEARPMNPLAVTLADGVLRVGDYDIDISDCPDDSSFEVVHVAVLDPVRTGTNASQAFVPGFESGLASALADLAAVVVIDDLTDLDVNALDLALYDMVVEFNVRPRIFPSAVVQAAVHGCTPLLPAQAIPPFWPNSNDWVLGPVTAHAATYDDALLKLVVDSEITSLAAFVIADEKHDVGAGHQLAKNERDIATSLFELPASESEPWAVLPPADEALVGVVEANPDVVLVEAYCRNTSERLRSAGYSGQLWLLYPECSVDLTGAEIGDWWDELMRVVTPGGLGNTDNEIEQDIAASLDVPDRFGISGNDPVGRIGWLNGWYVGALVTNAMEQDLSAPQRALLLAGALNLDMEHPFRETRLTANPENRLPINAMAVYRWAGDRWVAAGPPAA